MTSIAERHDAAGNERALAALTRDAALGRIGRARRWLLLVAVAMTAGLAALASSLLPGKSFAATGRLRTLQQGTGARTGRAAASSAVAPALPAPAGPGQLGLQGPAQAPQSSPSPSPPVQSSPPPASAPAPAPSTSGSGAVVSGGS